MDTLHALGEIIKNVLNFSSNYLSCATNTLRWW